MAACDLHSLPAGSRPIDAVRNNGPDNLALERYKLRELAEGWPMYRDACEWENLKSIFHADAVIYTTWTGRSHYLDFIAASQKGMDAGVFIMHRCHGLSTDIDRNATRAVTKMKATITQRFNLDGIEADAESDCRFCFFWLKIEKEWKAMVVRHWYEKDKLIPVDPNRVPKVDEAKVQKYPSGYRYLAYCQETTMGVNVLLDMPGHRRENGIAGGSLTCGENHDLLYWHCKQWLDGKDFEI
ncbi:hypothetical protein PV08_07250 [Exophiala spinifera]|uniref:SnoaL-like domain-containing protein n=1 Tax=Exophiala spinifera TaxID=91928 RepID=A0A0D1YHS2_9EURO|nr:uncharacterized protein PV08_07250 [Exophiala spinifera]KIW14466.1 hypothetical protein PV08_07250 [Exophiala spinifera]